MYSELHEMHPMHPSSSKEVILYARFHELHSQNRVPRETTPAGYVTQIACQVPSFEKSRDTAYPEKSLLILLNLPSNLTK